MPDATQVKPLLQSVTIGDYTITLQLTPSGGGGVVRITGSTADKLMEFRDKQGGKGNANAVFVLVDKPKPKEPQPLGEGPGTELKRIFESKEFPSCQQCIDMARNMNWLGVEGCRASVDVLVGKILPRAAAWLKAEKPWAQRLLGAVGADEALLKHEIRKHVNAAIDAAEAKEKASAGLMMLETAGPAEPAVDDEITALAESVWKHAAHQGGAMGVFLGHHKCSCGERSDNKNWRLPDGTETNSLLVHYVRHHRSEVPPGEIDKLRRIADELAKEKGE